MKSLLIFILLSFVFCSCTPGPVHVAKSEGESIKRNYNDKRTQDIFDRNADLFKDIYTRYNSQNVGFYTDGIGITTLLDLNKEELHYIMVYLRPKDAAFDINTTSPEERFSRILQEFVPRYISKIKSGDIQRNDIEGLAFGIYWVVRDHSQCDTHGGHIEYLYVFLPKNTAQNYLDGRITLIDAVDQSEVITSLNLQPAKSVRPIF